MREKLSPLDKAIAESQLKRMTLVALLRPNDSAKEPPRSLAKVVPFHHPKRRDRL